MKRGGNKIYINIRTGKLLRPPVRNNNFYVRMQECVCLFALLKCRTWRYISVKTNVSYFIYHSGLKARHFSGNSAHWIATWNVDKFLFEVNIFVFEIVFGLYEMRLLLMYRNEWEHQLFSPLNNKTPPKLLYAEKWG